MIRKLLDPSLGVQVFETACSDAAWWCFSRLQFHCTSLSSHADPYNMFGSVLQVASLMEPSLSHAAAITESWIDQQGGLWVRRVSYLRALLNQEGFVKFLRERKVASFEAGWSAHPTATLFARGSALPGQASDCMFFGR